jgi:CRP/FNR family transcriptional regulator, cyclic AMP receptor protein
MPSERLRDIEDALVRVRLFASLSREEIAALARVTTRRQVAAKKLIVEQGAPGTELFIIVEGTAQVVSLGTEGKDVTLGAMGAGEVFGEIALLDGGVRSATVRAKTKCSLLVLGQDAFFVTLMNHPAAAVKLLRILASRLRALTVRSEDRVFLDVPRRLAKEVLRWVEENPDERVSQSELGEMVGASRESVNKHLKLWQREGILSHARGRLTVLSRERLRALLAP